MLRKRGGIWHIDLARRVGPRLRKSTGTADKAAAQELHDTVAHRLWREEKLGELSRTWNDAVVDWTDAHGRHKKSFESDRTRLVWLSQRLKGHTLASIDGDTIARLKIECLTERTTKTASRTRSKATVNRHLAALSVILHHAHARGWIAAVPKIPYFTEPKGRIRWITREQAAALLRELPPHLNRMARFALATGLRQANVIGLRWDQIDTERAVAWIHADEAKAGKSLAIPLNDDALAVLRECTGQHASRVFVYKPIDPPNRPGHFKPRPVAGIGLAFSKACARAGIDRFTWHDLRHTWASWHIMNGTPVEVLQRLGGWADLKMVMRYAHLAPGYLAQYAGNSNLVTPTSQEKRPPEGSLDNTLIDKWNLGVADGVRTHDNWNHKPLAIAKSLKNKKAA